MKFRVRISVRVDYLFGVFGLGVFGVSSSRPMARSSSAKAIFRSIPVIIFLISFSMIHGVIHIGCGLYFLGHCALGSDGNFIARWRNLGVSVLRPSLEAKRWRT